MLSHYVRSYGMLLCKTINDECIMNVLATSIFVDIHIHAVSFACNLYICMIDQ